MGDVDIVAELEGEWDLDGFFGQLRDGDLQSERGMAVLRKLRALSFDDDSTLRRREVSLIWFIVSFMHWQTERLVERGVDAMKYRRLVDEFEKDVQRLLGVP